MVYLGVFMREIIFFFQIGGKPSKSYPSALSNSIEAYQAASKLMAPSVKSSDQNSALCLDPQFDAIFLIDDDTYIIKGM
jgi:hypothetical protein